MRKVVANTTPLIALADVGHLDLLQKMYQEILIPPSVLEEIQSEPAYSLIRHSAWIRILEIEKTETRMAFRSRLHAGEVDAIILALEQKADLVIMDDNAAKKTAKFHGLSVTGTLGVLIRAKEQGYISAVKPVMQRLLDDGFFISETVRQYVLAACGETDI